ncbi:hypothetical protein Scep_014599 [Stephania cephalantha]|uniref:Uncharacterized protein n=1 Tax=Stephania cephalantha TaxID=152367 RepID=A0AAP0P0J2_9MAGN
MLDRLAMRMLDGPSSSSRHGEENIVDFLSSISATLLTHFRSLYLAIGHYPMTHRTFIVSYNDRLGTFRIFLDICDISTNTHRSYYKSLEAKLDVNLLKKQATIKKPSWIAAPQWATRCSGMTGYHCKLVRYTGYGTLGMRLFWLSFLGMSPYCCFVEELLKAKFSGVGLVFRGSDPLSTYHIEGSTNISLYESDKFYFDYAPSHIIHMRRARSKGSSEEVTDYWLFTLATRGTWNCHNNRDNSSE